MANKKIIKCIVACTNANGDPDLFFVKVKCTDKQFENGDHYDSAKAHAEQQGYEPFLAYDEVDSAGKAMLVLGEWDSFDTIQC